MSLISLPGYENSLAYMTLEPEISKTIAKSLTYTKGFGTTKAWNTVIREFSPPYSEFMNHIIRNTGSNSSEFTYAAFHLRVVGIILDPYNISTFIPLTNIFENNEYHIDQNTTHITRKVTSKVPTHFVYTYELLYHNLTVDKTLLKPVIFPDENLIINNQELYFFNGTDSNTSCSYLLDPSKMYCVDTVDTLYVGNRYFHCTDLSSAGWYDINNKKYVNYSRKPRGDANKKCVYRPRKLSMKSFAVRNMFRQNESLQKILANRGTRFKLRNPNNPKHVLVCEYPPLTKDCFPPGNETLYPSRTRHVWHDTIDPVVNHMCHLLDTHKAMWEKHIDNNWPAYREKNRHDRENDKVARNRMFSVFKDSEANYFKYAGPTTDFLENYAIIMIRDHVIPAQKWSSAWPRSKWIFQIPNIYWSEETNENNFLVLDGNNKVWDSMSSKYYGTLEAEFVEIPSAHLWKDPSETDDQYIQRSINESSVHSTRRFNSSGDGKFLLIYPKTNDMAEKGERHLLFDGPDWEIELDLTKGMPRQYTSGIFLNVRISLRNSKIYGLNGDFDFPDEGEHIVRPYLKVFKYSTSKPVYDPSTPPPDNKSIVTCVASDTNNLAYNRDYFEAVIELEVNPENKILAEEISKMYYNMEIDKDNLEEVDMEIYNNFKTFVCSNPPRIDAVVRKSTKDITTSGTVTSVGQFTGIIVSKGPQVHSRKTSHRDLSPFRYRVPGLVPGTPIYEEDRWNIEDGPHGEYSEHVLFPRYMTKEYLFLECDLHMKKYCTVEGGGLVGHIDSGSYRYPDLACANFYGSRVNELFDVLPLAALRMDNAGGLRDVEGNVLSEENVALIEFKGGNSMHKTAALRLRHLVLRESIRSQISNMPDSYINLTNESQKENISSTKMCVFRETWNYGYNTENMEKNNDYFKCPDMCIQSLSLSVENGAEATYMSDMIQVCGNTDVVPEENQHQLDALAAMNGLLSSAWTATMENKCRERRNMLSEIREFHNILLRAISNESDPARAVAIFNNTKKTVNGIIEPQDATLENIRNSYIECEKIIADYVTEWNNHLGTDIWPVTMAETEDGTPSVAADYLISRKKDLLKKRDEGIYLLISTSIPPSLQKYIPGMTDDKDPISVSLIESINYMNMIDNVHSQLLIIQDFLEELSDEMAGAVAEFSTEIITSIEPTTVFYDPNVHCQEYYTVNIKPDEVHMWKASGDEVSYDISFIQNKSDTVKNFVGTIQNCNNKIKKRKQTMESIYKNYNTDILIITTTEEQRDVQKKCNKLAVMKSDVESNIFEIKHMQDELNLLQLRIENTLHEINLEHQNYILSTSDRIQSQIRNAQYTKSLLFTLEKNNKKTRFVVLGDDDATNASTEKEIEFQQMKSIQKFAETTYSKVCEKLKEIYISDASSVVIVNANNISICIALLSFVLPFTVCIYKYYMWKRKKIELSLVEKK